MQRALKRKFEENNQNLPKVLLAAPTSKVKEYCASEWIGIIKNLTYSNYDIFIVDNSYDKGYVRRFTYYGIETAYIEPNGRSREYMCQGNELIRNKVISEGYDYLLSLESDIFPPADIIEKLLVHNKDVVGAPYFLHKGENTGCILTESAFLPDVSAPNIIAMRTYNVLDAFMECDGELHETTMVGLGCVLISRRVLEKIRFRVGVPEDAYADSFFYEDCLLNNIPVFQDSSLYVEHRNSDWGAISDYSIYNT